MQLRSMALALAGIVPALASSPVQLSYSIQTIAGSSNVGDSGPAISAALSDAEGVATDASGNIFIADANDHRVRKITPDGKISTVAGDGFPGFRGDGGPASAARLNTPYGIAVDRAGNLYIADLGNNRVRKVGPDGAISTVPGTDQLLAPRNVALDAAGTLYISEFGGQRIRKLGADGVVGTAVGNGVAGYTGDGGPAAAAQLSYPAGLAFDSAGNLFIADSSNNCIRKVSKGVISTVLGTGDPGSALPNQLNLPTGVAIDSAGNLYVADSANQRIQQLASNAVISTVPGAGRDLTIDPAGNLYIASGPQLLELTAAQSLSVIAGDGSYAFRGDGGDATSARLNGPIAVAIAPSGAFYIADQKNLRVRMVTSAGVISTAAGDGTAGTGTDELDFPAGVAIDPSGAVSIADQNNDRIQKLNPDGTISTLAGIGSPGFNGDGIPATAAQLFSPGALSFASDGTLYLADAGNQRVRMIGPSGVISTVAQLSPRGVAVDGLGNVYVSDGAAHRVVRIDARGRPAVIAGTGAAGFAGDGGPAAAAQLNSPTGLAADQQGNLYIADTGNNRIRVVGPDGSIRTIAGTGAADFDGDGGPALSAAINGPTGLVLDSAGNLWVADTGNNRIRELTVAPLASPVSQAPSVVNAASMLPGPVAPGEIVSIFGTGLGPVTAAGGSLDSTGILANQVAQTQVLFDGTPAPLFYVQDGQINAQTPYEIAGKATVDVEVFFQDISRGKATVPVAASAPGIFTILAGRGAAVAINQDGKLNSPDDPAPRGSIVTLYATGEGLTDPAGADGRPAAAPFPKPTLAVGLSVGGYPAEILFAGEAPGFAGLMQINARLPGGFAPTGDVPVILTIGAAASRNGVTISVQ